MAQRVAAGSTCCTGWPRTTRSPSSTSRSIEVDGTDVAVHEAGRDREAVLPAAPLQALHRRPADAAAAQEPADGADRRAAVGPLLDAAARHGARACCRTTRSTSPTGPTRAWCRCRQGPFHLDDYVAYVQEFIRHLGPDGQRDLGLPADGAGAGGGLADGERAARRRRCTMTMMGGPIDARKTPDRGQQPGDEQELSTGSRTT